MAELGDDSGDHLSYHTLSTGASMVKEVSCQEERGETVKTHRHNQTKCAGKTSELCTRVPDELSIRNTHEF